MAYRPTERTEARRTQTRARIVRAAPELVAQGGYREAQVAAVARRAGVATGTVYRHFPSKADLLTEVFRVASQREVDAVAAASGENARRVDRRRGRDVRAARAARAAAGMGAAGRAGRSGRRGRAAAVPPRLCRRLRLHDRRGRRARRVAAAGPGLHRHRARRRDRRGARRAALPHPRRHRRRRARRPPHHLLPAFHHRSGAL